MGRKNFFRGFYLQGKNRFKGQKSVGQKPYKNFNRIIPPKGPKVKSFLKSDLPSYGQTLITEHRKTGRENFSCGFSIHDTTHTKFTVKTLITEYRKMGRGIFSFGFCLIKNSNRTFSFETAYKGSKGQ